MLPIPALGCGSAPGGGGACAEAGAGPGACCPIGAAGASASRPIRVPKELLLCEASTRTFQKVSVGECLFQAVLEH